MNTENDPMAGDAHADAATPAPAQEYDVVLRVLVTPAPPSEEALEELAIAAVEAVERDAAEQVLGVAASCEFEPAAIELDFNVRATSPVEMHGKLGQVLAALVANLPITIEAFSETAAPTDRELVAA